MKILVLGAGMMGRAIAYDLSKYSNFETITISDKSKKNIKIAEKFLENKKINYNILNLNKKDEITKNFKINDIVISAVPYKYNYILAKTAIDTKTHFIDLGGNNTIVDKEKKLHEKAKKAKITIIPDCGLAPGLTSILTKKITEKMDQIDYIKIRVGGLPVRPKPPLDYQIVFSPYGLLNEYIEDALILKNKKIIKKKSMTEIEQIKFPKPYENMEAFLTSGGCSTLPYTYKNKIKYLDYKTIRYPGHCEKFKTLIDLGLSKNKEIKIGKQKIIPREILVNLLLKKLPKNQEDVVLLKILSKGKKGSKTIHIDYTMIDYFDKEKNITSMMRTTGYPVSITAQMIEKKLIKKPGVYCSEEIIPTKPFIKELEKRKIRFQEEIY